MTKFPEVFGTTDEFRNRIFEQGYMDIQTVRPEDVIDAEYDRKWVPDFRKVFAIINIAGEQGTFNSILLMANQRLIKCRLSPNMLISRLKHQFVLDAHHDVGGVARSMGITTFIPYVCGDYLLMPVGKRNAQNNSWIRVYTTGEFWEHQKKKSLVCYPQISILRVPHGRKSIEDRKLKCEDISFCYQEYAKSLLTTIKFPEAKRPRKNMMAVMKKRIVLFTEELLRKLAE